MLNRASLFAKVKNPETRKAMVQIVSLIIPLLSTLDKSRIDYTKESILRIQRVIHLPKDWVNYLATLLKLLDSYGSSEEMLKDNKFIEILRKLLLFKIISTVDLDAEQLLEEFLLLKGDSLVAKGIQAYFNSYRGNSGWDEICDSLDFDPKFRYYFDHLNLIWRSGKGDYLKSSCEKESKLDPLRKISDQNTDRGLVFPFKDIESERPVSDIHYRCNNLHWMARLYHLSLNYEGNSLNVKRFHWLMINKMEYFHSMLLHGLESLGLFYDDPLVSEVARLVLKNLYTSQDIELLKTGQVKILNLSLNSSKGLRTVADKIIIIVETDTWKLIPLLINVSEMKRFEKVFAYYPGSRPRDVK